MNDGEIESVKLLKLKYRKGDQIIQTFWKIGYTQSLGPLSLICRFVEISRLWEKYYRIIQNALKSKEWEKIWDNKTFKIEIQKAGPNNSDFLQNWFPP